MRRTIILVLFLFVGIPASATTRVAASGVTYETGLGTYASPWNFHAAMNAGSETKVAAGETLYVRGGTYTPTSLTYFYCNIPGTAANPIKIMPYPGETVTLKLTNNASATVVFGLEADHLWLMGFTIYTDHDTTSTNFVDCIRVLGDSCRIINNIIHNSTNNAIADQDTAGTLVYGNILYNNGRRHTGGNAYSVYVQNIGSRKYYENNIILNTQAGYAVHGYTESNRVDSITFRNNVVIGMLGADAAPAVVWSAAPGPVGIVMDSNYVYGRKINTFYDRNALQERKGMTSPYFADNWILQSTFRLRETTTGRTFTRNFVWGDWPHLSNTINESGWNLDSTTIPGNILYIDSVVQRANPQTEHIRMIPNRFATNRGHLVVVNLDSGSTVSVPSAELAKILANNDSFYVYDPQNIFGGYIASGKYTTGTPYTLSMTSTAVEMPLSVAEEQNTFGYPIHTDRKFNAFLVTTTGIGGEGGGGTPAATPSKRLKGRKR